MNKVIVTGATGFIGSNLVRKLVQNGFEVYLIVRENSKLNNIQDILNKVNIFIFKWNIDELIQYFKDISPTCVFHLASCFIAEHKKEDIENLIDSNLKFGAFLLEAMNLAGIKKIINTGTSWQHYNDEEYNPVCLYAATKEAFEKLIKYYVDAKGFSVITIKLFDTYGENDSRNKLINNLEQYSLSNKVLDLSYGDQLMNLTHIDDIVDGYLIALNKVNSLSPYQYESYALSAEHLISLKNLVNLFESVTGYKINVNWGKRPYREREVMLPWTRYALLGGWKPKISLEKGLERIVKFK